MSAFPRSAIVAALAAVAAGCDIGDPHIPPDGSAESGLSITWESRPAPIPSERSSNITIRSAVFRQERLRVVGEAGTFMLERDKLEWAQGVVPAALPVPGASPGLYVGYRFDLEGDEEDDEHSFEITGTVEVDDDDYEFTIRDDDDFQLSLDFEITLPAGGTIMIPVRVEIDKIVEAVNFQSLTRDNGRYVVDDESSQISNVRSALRTAFGVHGPS